MISIRLLTPDDQPVLWEMLYYTLYVPAGVSPFPRDIILQPEISRYVMGWGQPHDQGLIAYDQGKPVGAAWFRLLTGDQKGFGYADDLTPELAVAVLPENRNKGVGTLLLTELLEVARRSHFQALSLSVNENNPAKFLYRRLGFESAAKQGASITMIKRFRQQLND